MKEVRVRTEAIGQHVVRHVIHDWDGEYWNSYLIVPRDLVLKSIRAQRAKGIPWSSISTLKAVSRWVAYAHHSGPGSPYANEAKRLRRCNRNYMVVTQSGGWDI